MTKKIFCLAAALLLSNAAYTLMAQQPAQYKMELEAEQASGSWKIGLGVDAAQGALVWADFNGNGKKDVGEEWSATRVDKDGICNFTKNRTSVKLAIYGPVKTLICAENALLSLNTESNPELVNLAANNNSISIISINKNTKLERVNLENNQIPRIKLEGLVNLIDIRLNGNAKIASLDLKGVDALQMLDVSETRVTSITNANFSQLKGINLSGAEGFDFNVLKDARLLENLGMAGSKVSTVDLKRHPMLMTLWAPNCELEQLDFSGNPELRQVMLNYNKLRMADFSKNMKINHIHLENNNLEALKLPAGSPLKTLNVSGVKTLTSIDVSQQPKLRALQIDGVEITSLDLSANENLMELTMSETAIKELNLSKAPMLNTLNVAGCKQLTKLDLSGCAELSTLYCGKSGLTELDLSACTSLTEFSGDHNGFTRLTFNSNSLTRVDCAGNNIRGQAMTDLINSLPKVRSGNFFVVDMSVGQEKNHCSVEQVKLARDKGWQVFDKNMAGSSYINFDGMNTDALEALTSSTAKVYPTTATRAFYVEGTEGSHYHIYTLSGELVRKGYITQSVQSVSVDGLPIGSYLVRLEGVGAYRVEVAAN